ncbi:MAG: hypothetical protein ACI85I_001111 [Arenicella sp.]|jgi:hypothetical protein
MSYEFEKVEAEKMELQMQRDFGEKINASFEFLKLNFAPFYRGVLFIMPHCRFCRSCVKLN